MAPAAKRLGPRPSRNPIRHAVKPAWQEVSVPDRRCLADQHQERRLEGVLDVPRVAEHPSTQAQHHRTVQVHQRLEGGLIPTRPVTLQELPVPQTAQRPVTVTGTPNAGEYLTAIINRNAVLSSGQSTLPAVLSDLVSQAAHAGYTVTTDGVSTLTFPPLTYQLDVRRGGMGTLGKVTHRQRQAVMIATWAPNHVSRTAIAAAIDVLVKQNIIVPMPDTSQCKLTL